MSVRHLYAPTKAGAAEVRADLKARGLVANVRFFRHSIRIVLPAYTAEAAEIVRQYMLERGLCLAGGSKPEGDAWRFSWSIWEGRGQVFAYSIR